MAWDDDDLREEIAGMFVATLSLRDDSLPVRQLSHYSRPPGRSGEELREYKRQKKREYEERDRSAPPSEVTRAELRRKLVERKAMRERMPELRAGVTHHFAILAKCNKLKCVAGKIEGRDGLYDCPRCGGSGIREVDGYLTCNTYEDGRLGEIFIRLGKMGSEEAVYEQWAVGASIALQHGVPVEAYFRKFLATQNEPSGATKNKEIPRCTSILDYVSRYVLLKHVKVEKPEEVST